MQRRSSTIYLFFTLAFAWFIFSAFPSNPPNGFTGAPGEGTCTTCHSTINPEGLDGEITFSGLPPTISPNTTYTITLTVSNPNALGSDAGFQWVALNSSNLNAGNMSNSSSGATITAANNRVYHEHSPAQGFGLNTEVSWTVDWTAPSTITNNETITFYAAGLVGNGGDGDNGDFTVTTSASTILTDGQVPLSVQISTIQNVSCNGATDGQIDIEITNGESPFTFNWSNGSTTENPGLLSAGTIALTLTDANNCIATASTILSEPSILLVNASISNESAAGANDGMANVQPSGGTMPYSIEWSTGDTSSTISNLAPGNYGLTLTDANQCTTSSSITINAFNCNLGMLSVNANTIICPNSATGSIDIESIVGAVDPIQFSWSTGDTTASINNLSAGTYIVTITDANNCGINEPFQIIEQDTEAPVIICPESMLSNACSEIINYELPTVSDNCGIDTLERLQGLASGLEFLEGITTISYRVTDNSGNTADCSFEISLISDLNAVVNTTPVSCNGFSDGSISLDISGGTPPYSVENMMNGFPVGVFSFPIQDATGCEIEVQATIEEPEAISVQIDSITLETEQEMDGAIAITVSGGTPSYSYQWVLDDLVLSVEEDPINLGAGTYLLIITDANACFQSFEIEIDRITSTIEADLQGEIQVYPNPTTGMVYMNMPSNSSELVEIHLFDVSGGTPILNLEVLPSETSIDLSNLANGIYILQIQKGQERKIEKIMISQ